MTAGKHFLPALCIYRDKTDGKGYIEVPTMTPDDEIVLQLEGSPSC
jgi:hypothetical protein